MIARGKTGKPIVGVIGFLGRGNAGDEAIFQCIYEAFRQKFDIVVAVDEHGAKQGWWDWYPYNEIDRIHQGNIHYFEKRIAGLIVGGGGLGIGFGASQALIAQSAGTPTAFVGTDHTHTIQTSQTGMIGANRFLNLFDYVALRSKESVKWAAADGVSACYGADWALALTTDRSEDHPFDGKRAAVVFREFPADMLASHYRHEATRLLSGLTSRGYQPLIVPLSPEDEKFNISSELTSIVPQEVHWWNPRRIQQIISASSLLVTMGRLHSMIFAANVGVQNIQIKPPLRKDVSRHHFRKLEVMAEELCVPYLESVDEALKQLDGPIDTSEMRAAADQAKKRLKTMTDNLHDLFSA
ncbi:polysaccharide pyruvyl transferase family protein [Agrobacterium tumefaciens]|uniref:polysaccharide pyruvyl transferase family protein n=1 Tax=Agrobacterium tumefaciens TaxID=358 RepID=UPI000DD0563E|nr:polysaccharide pyruvyl transferase family protein [Agrobacterium tumefaciens]MDP9791394.1 hypothetical protein [Agrobacterium tumefaciens]